MAMEWLILGAGLYWIGIAVTVSANGSFWVVAAKFVPAILGAIVAAYAASKLGIFA